MTKRMDEIRPSSFSIYSNCQQSLIAPTKRKLSTMITKNRADFIIAVIGIALNAKKLELGIYSLLQL